jgi:putative cell wall-binding protein
MSFRLLDEGAGDPHWVPATDYATSVGPLELTSAEGTKTVVGTFRDHAGNSIDVTRTIALDTAPPTFGGWTSSHVDSVWSNDAYPTVGWGATDSVTGVADYSLSIGGGSAEATQATEVTWTEPAEEGDTVVAVTARDRAGHESATESFTLKIDTLSPTEPTVSSPSHDRGVYSSDFRVEVDVAGASDPDAGTTGSGIAWFRYSWSADTPSTATNYVQGPSFAGDTASLPHGTWYFNVVVEDGAGNRSAFAHSGPYLIDLKAPGAPVAPTATSSSGIVALDWPDSPEDDVTSYRVYRSDSTGGAERRIGEVAGSSFTDTGVENGVTYRYRVSAVDHLDHESQASPSVSVIPWADNVVSRTAGADRYQTAIAIADAHFDPADVETVVLATGEDFADALAASGLAGAYDAPLLLVRRGQVPSEVFARMDAYPNLQHVFIVGGTGVISEWVQAAFAQRYGENGVWGPTGVLVQRFAGPTRYETAAAVALQVFRATDGQSAERVLVARGDVFADALAIAPIAYATERPVLLVTPNTLPGPVVTLVRDLRVKEAVIAGGPGAVSGGAQAQLDALLAANGGAPSERWYGADRYATASAIARGGIGRGWVEPTFVGTATGSNFPDALGGGVATGAEGGVLTLTAPTALSPDAARFVSDHSALIERLEVFGGAGAVAPSVETTLRGLLD